MPKCEKPLYLFVEVITKMINVLMMGNQKKRTEKSIGKVHSVVGRSLMS